MNKIAPNTPSQITKNESPTSDGDPLYAVNPNKKGFYCTYPDCGKSFRYKSEMERHTATHKEARPYECTHPGCKKSFKRNDALLDHMKIHSKDVKFNCTIMGCEKKFTTKASLRYHMNKYHKDSSKPESSECSQKSTTSDGKHKASTQIENIQFFPTQFKNTNQASSSINLPQQFKPDFTMESSDIYGLPTKKIQVDMIQQQLQNMMNNNNSNQNNSPYTQQAQQQCNNDGQFLNFIQTIFEENIKLRTELAQKENLSGFDAKSYPDSIFNMDANDFAAMANGLQNGNNPNGQSLLQTLMNFKNYNFINNNNFNIISGNNTQSKLNIPESNSFYSQMMNGQSDSNAVAAAAAKYFSQQQQQSQLNSFQNQFPQNQFSNDQQKQAFLLNGANNNNNNNTQNTQNIPFNLNSQFNQINRFASN